MFDALEVIHEFQRWDIGYREGIGFDSERNAVTILTADETITVPETTKWEVAQRVLDCAVQLKKKLLAPSR